MRFRRWIAQWKNIAFVILVLDFVKAQAEEIESSPEQLLLSPNQPTQNQPAGASFALFCNKGSGDGIYSDFKWIGPQGQEITQNATALIHAFVSENGLALNFDKPTPENSGRYTCKALYGGASKLEMAVKISFFHDITFDNCPTSQELVLERDGTVHCHVHGNPVPRVRWGKYPDTRLPSERFTIEGSSLQIRHVVESDAGKYRVTAMVEATGKIKRQYIMVNVITPPTITELKNVSQITEGAPGTVICSVSGVPPPRCYWTDFKERNLSYVSGFRITPEACLLEFTQSFRDHEGLYKCHAVNPAGTDTRETRVEVIIPPRVIEFQNKTVDENDEVTLTCQAEGKPLPKIHIHKEKTAAPLGYNNDEGFVTLKHQSSNYTATLIAIISSVQLGHAGLYFCSVENNISRVERTGKLDVNYAPILMAKENPVYTWANRPATLTCHIQAIPNATVEWRGADGNLLQDETMFTIDNSIGVSVFIVNEQADRYDRDFVCTAINNLGERSLTFTIREARRPEAPSQPKVQRITATTVTFKFNRLVNNGGMPILEYLIHYWHQGQRPDEAEAKTFSDIISKPLSITKLLPLTKYYFTFSARSEVGEGPHSQQMIVDTTGEAVPDRPMFVNPPDADVQPSRVHIEWTMPLDNGKRVDHFLVSYQLAEQITAGEFRDTGRKRTDKVTSWSSIIAKDLFGLAPGMFYRVRVQAHNELGYGEPAELIFRTGSASEMIGAHPHNGTNDVGNASFIRTPLIIALAILLTFVFLILIDVLCYFQFRKGLLYALRHLLCAKPKHVYSKTNQSPITSVRPSADDPFLHKNI
ncbi:fasciclin-2-like [Tropilaelaps mercedesae]|uniref:Fasciclin-2-like n=1 Tax=Tropilaelaps mercedesae TaxID=418985 RepID=A0A1V9XXT2_9ACAR|nr:fasciclin-2-like [Tropilaelaps mercedesae]